MKTEYTPGPWRLGDAGQTVFGPPCGAPSPKTVARLPKLSAPCKVADIDENIANARLISTAPELLEALDQVMRTLEKANDAWGTANPDNPEKMDLMIARAAIAKAKGQ